VSKLKNVPNYKKDFITAIIFLILGVLLALLLDNTGSLLIWLVFSTSYAYKGYRGLKKSQQNPNKPTS